MSIRSSDVPLRRGTSRAEAGPVVVRQYPGVQDLAANLRFDPASGRIWLYDQPVLVSFVSAFAEQRKEIIDAVGMDSAREIYTRQGYREGVAYIDVARHIRSPEHLAEYFAIGPQLRAMQGCVRIEPVRIEFDVSRGTFYSEVIWHDTLESQAHLASYGVGVQSSCWMEVGAACGFCTTFMGRPILHREVECRALGHQHCRAIGMPLEDWDDPSGDLRFLQFAPFINRVRPRRARKPPSVMTPGPKTSQAPNSIRDRDIVGASSGFNAAVQLIKKVARSSTAVLFIGESGVGKEVGARTLHALSDRADQPFIAVNCAAIPESLIEAELFGVQKGAFTGATESRPGRFERAHGGTLFLDEIATLSLPAQGKLLRALQEREIERVGDTQVRPIDVRIVAATNIDLRSAIAASQFRQDLFYRLNVFPIRIAPLRERRADIPLMMESFLTRAAARHGKRISGFNRHAIDCLLRYTWPGNVRELENMIERAVILCPDDGAIDAHHLFTGGEQLDAPLYVPGTSGTLVPVDGLESKGNEDAALDWPEFAKRCLAERGRFKQVAREMQEAFIDAALQTSDSNITGAARLLGLSYGQVAYHLRRRNKP